MCVHTQVAINKKKNNRVIERSPTEMTESKSKREIERETLRFRRRRE